MLGTILIVIVILMLVVYSTHLAAQQTMGLLSQRWNWLGSTDFSYPAADGPDLNNAAFGRKGARK